MINPGDFYKWAKVFGLIGGTPIPGGDVFGPASATVNAVARYLDVTGKVIKNSLLLVNDAGDVTTPGSIASGLTRTTLTTGTTITGAMIKGGLIVINPPDGSQAFTWDSAANIYTALGSPPLNTAINCKIVNSSGDFQSFFLNSDLDVSAFPLQPYLIGQQGWDLSFEVKQITPTVQIAVCGGTDIAIANILGGKIRNVVMTSSTIDSSEVGGTTPAPGTFTDLSATASILFPNNDQNMIHVSSTAPTGTPDGSVYNPYPNVGAVMAAGLPASASNPITIIMSGVITETANVVLKPYYAITGNSPFGTQWNLDTFNVTLDPSWDTGFAFGTMSKVLVNGTGAINFDTSAYTGGGVKLFFNDGIFFAVNVTLTADSSTIWAMLPGCNMQPPLTLTLNNVPQAFLLSDVFNGNLAVTSASVGHDTTVFTQGLLMLPGSTATATSTGTDLCNLTINSSTVQPGSLTGDGANTTIFMDVGSFIPAILTGGAVQLVTPVAIEAGGTGQTTLPTHGQLLVGTSGNTFDLAPLVGAGGITVGFSEIFHTYTIDGSGIGSSYPFGYWYGLHIAYASNTNITMEEGAAIDSTNTYKILSSFNVLDTTTTGVNGLDVGPVSPNAQYYVFNIGDSTGVNPGRILASLNPSSPTLPSPYDIFRGIGAFTTDGVGDINFYSVLDLINKLPIDNPTFTGSLGTNTGNFLWEPSLNTFIAGDGAHITGGSANTLLGNWSTSNYSGCFVWSDGTATSGANHYPSADNQFLTWASGGFGINTNNTSGGVHEGPQAGFHYANNYGTDGKFLFSANDFVVDANFHNSEINPAITTDRLNFKYQDTVGALRTLTMSLREFNNATVMIQGDGAAPNVTFGTNQELVCIGPLAGASIPNSPTNPSRSMFIGYNAGANYTTSGNPNDQHTGVGYFSLRLLTTGMGNAAFGATSLFGNTTGSFNTGIGGGAGAAITTGSNNICIGYQANVSVGGAANRVVIGQGATGSTDNQVVLGNSSTLSIISNGLSATLGLLANPFANTYSTKVTVDRIEGLTNDLRINPQASGFAIYLGHDHASSRVYIGAGSTSSLFQVTNTTSTQLAVNDTSVTTSNLSVQAGKLFLDNQTPSAITTSSGTLTPAQLFAKVIPVSSGSVVNLDWGSAATLLAAMANPVVGGTLDLMFVNFGSAQLNITNTTDPTHVGVAALIGGASVPVSAGTIFYCRLIVTNVSTPAVAIFGGPSVAGSSAGVALLAANNVFTGQNSFLTQETIIDIINTSFMGGNGPMYTTSTMGFAAVASGLKTNNSFTLTASEVANVIVRLNGSLSTQTVFMPTAANFDAQILASYPAGKTVPTFTTFHLRVINESTTATATMTANTNFLISNTTIATLLPGSYKDFLINKTAGTPEYTLY